MPPWNGARPPRRRFGNYPKAIAAQSIARSFRTTQGFGDAAEARAFGDMLRATQRGSAGSAPPGQDAGGVVEAAWPGSPVDAAAFSSHPLPLALRHALGVAPILLAQAEEAPGEEEGRSLPGGPVEDLAEAARTSSFGEALRELRELEPDNPALTMLRTPDWAPDDAAVARMEGALAAARARRDPSRDTRRVEEQLGLPSSTLRSGAPGDAGDGFGDAGSPEMPSFRDGNGGGAPASMPTGQSGSPLNIMPGTNARSMIGGRDYTGHAMDEMQSDGITPAVAEEAIGHGNRYPGSKPRTVRFFDPRNKVTVITDLNGSAITVYRGGKDK